MTRKVADFSDEIVLELKASERCAVQFEATALLAAAGDDNVVVARLVTRRHSGRTGRVVSPRRNSR
jgi:hypothetical protein